MSYDQLNTFLGSPREVTVKLNCKAQSRSILAQGLCKKL